MKKSKILVTGGAGFIGSHIVDLLVDEGHKVIVVDNLSSGNEDNLNKHARLFKIDIQDAGLERIFREERPEYLIHQAAQIDVRRSVADPVYDASVNILGTINLLQNCVAYNLKKVIFASSGGAIYGEQESFPASESHPFQPISPYGIAKLTVEHYLFYYMTVHGLDYTALRYANVYGPRQDPFGEAGVVAVFTMKMLNGEQTVINGDGEQTRDFVYVEDVARANVLALANNTSEKAFNIGTGIETSINQLFDLLRNFIDPSIKKKYGPFKAGEQLRSVLNCSKAKDKLHWNCGTPIENGLKKTVEYFRLANIS